MNGSIIYALFILRRLYYKYVFVLKIMKDFMEELNMVNYIGVCTLEEDVFHVWKNVFYASMCPNMSILEALTHTHTHTQDVL